MSDQWKGARFGEADDLELEPELHGVFDALDPGAADPGYWMRFRAWVLANASAELARRRLMAELTVGDVMTSWARAVVPTAMLAAALAGILLMRAREEAQAPMTVEEMLVADVEGLTIPAALDLSETGTAVAFAAETF